MYNGNEVNYCQSVAHYTNEILQIIDFYNDNSLISKCKYGELFDFNKIKNDSKHFQQADVFCVEISSIHGLIYENNIYYNTVTVNKNESFKDCKNLL